MQTTTDTTRLPMQIASKGLLALLLAALLYRPVSAFCASIPALHSAYLMLLSFLISYLLMPLLIMIGRPLGLIDHPDEARKQHAVATPLTGGLGIYLACMITILLNFHFSDELKAIVIASTAIFVIGLVDDRFGLSAQFRLTVQVAAAGYLIVSGVHLTFVPGYLGGIVTETILTVIWIIGITNSMNFIDGMDGLASGTSIIYAVFFSIAAVILKEYYMMFFAAAIAGSCLGFFPYNFRRGKPARVFLGDSGATFLGFLLASFAILGEWGDNIVDIAVPVLIMSVLIFDMTLTTVVRIATGEVRGFGQWLHYTGRDHFHHRLHGLGISQKQAALLFFAVSVCFGLQALAILFANTTIAVLILVQTGLSFAILGVVLVTKGSGK